MRTREIGNGNLKFAAVTAVTANIPDQEDIWAEVTCHHDRFGGDAMLLFHFMLLVAIGALFLIIFGACKEFHELWASFHQDAIARHSHFARPRTR